MKHARDDYQNIQEIVTNGTVRRIPADEPVFLLRGQDCLAAETVEFYADRVERSGGDPKIVAASREQARKMRQWPKHKMPDLPNTTEGSN